jgi:hypothetical protein
MLGTCFLRMGDLVGDATLGAPAQAAAKAWSAAIDRAVAASKVIGAYYDHGDWKDDAYASGTAKWAALASARTALEQALVAVRADLVPAIDKQIAGFDAALPAGSPKHATLALALRLEALLQAVSDRAAPTVVKSAVVAVLAAEPTPRDERLLRDDMPELAELERIGALPVGYSLDRIRYLSQMTGDKAPFAELPPEPEPGCNTDAD